MQNQMKIPDWAAEINVIVRRCAEDSLFTADVLRAETHERRWFLINEAYDYYHAESEEACIFYYDHPDR